MRSWLTGRVLHKAPLPGRQNRGARHSWACTLAALLTLHGAIRLVRMKTGAVQIMTLDG
jgi:hypothetical protein